MKTIQKTGNKVETKTNKTKKKVRKIHLKKRKTKAGRVSKKEIYIKMRKNKTKKV